jgi:hypothetical protein
MNSIPPPQKKLNYDFGGRDSVVEALCYNPEGRSSIPDKVTNFLSNLPILFSSTVTLGFTQHLREMNTENISGGKARPARKADNLIAIC